MVSGNESEGSFRTDSAPKKWFEILDQKKFIERFLSNSSQSVILVSSIGSLFEASKRRNLKDSSEDIIPNYENREKVYLTCSNIPFVFELERGEVQKTKIKKIKYRLSKLEKMRRNRIVESLKEASILFNGLRINQGELIGQAQSIIQFIHPIDNTLLGSSLFDLDVKKSKDCCSAFHFLKNLPNLNIPLKANIEALFPLQCCIIRITLYWMGNKRSSYNLVWFSETTIKKNKVYHCAIHLYSNLKCNLYFMRQISPHPFSFNPLGQCGQGLKRPLNNCLELILLHIKETTHSKQEGSQRKYKVFYDSLESINSRKIIQGNYKFNIPVIQNARESSNLSQEIPQAKKRIQMVLNNEVKAFNLYFSERASSNLRADQHQLSNLFLNPLKPPSSEPDIRSQQNLLPTKSKFRSTENLIQIHKIPSKESLAILIAGSPNKLLSCIEKKAQCSALQDSISSLDPVTDKALLADLINCLAKNVVPVFCGVFGNFFAQVLILKLDKDLRILLLHTISKNFAILACNNKAIFGLQKLLEELVFQDEVELFFKLILKNFDQICKNKNGGFLIKKFFLVIENLNFRDSGLKSQSGPRSFLAQTCKKIEDTFVKIINDKYGLCLVKNIIEISSNDKLLVSRFSYHFLTNIERGKHKPYFNFGLQELHQVIQYNEWKFDSYEQTMESFLISLKRPLVYIKVLGETLSMFLDYHDQVFIQERIIPRIQKMVKCPMNEAEQSLFAKLARKISLFPPEMSSKEEPLKKIGDQVKLKNDSFTQENQNFGAENSQSSSEDDLNKKLKTHSCEHSQF